MDKHTLKQQKKKGYLGRNIQVEYLGSEQTEHYDLHKTTGRYSHQ